MFLSKYGVARHIYIPIVKRAVVDFAVGADWTPAAGDVKISKDGGAAANVTNLPTAIAMGNGAIWDFSLTATEMQAAQIIVTVADSATKAVEDQSFIIETYGNASGQHAVDLSDSVRAGLTALPNAAAAASGGLIINGANAGTVTLGDGLVVNRSSANSDAVSFAGSGTGHGLKVRSGTGATGNGLDVAASSTNGHAVNLAGAGTGDGLKTSGGTTGHGIDAIGGSAAAAGDGIKGSVLGTGVPIRGDLTGNITGNLSGSVGSVTGSVGSVTGAVGSVTGLTPATVHADLDDIQARLPAALVGGRIDASVGAMAANTLTAAAIAADAITSAKIADGAIDAATFAAGAINAAAIAADAIGASELAADAVAEIADAVWEEAIADHSGTAGSTAAKLAAAGAAGDPWATALPGAYGAGQAGKIVGDNLNATVSSRASQTSVDTIDDFVDTEVSAIKAKTDQLNFTVAGKLDCNILFVNGVQVQGTGAGGNEWRPV